MADPGFRDSGSTDSDITGAVVAVEEEAACVVTTGVGAMVAGVAGADVKILTGGLALSLRRKRPMVIPASTIKIKNTIITFRDIELV